MIFEKLGLEKPERAYDYPADEWRLVQKARGYRWIVVNGRITFEDDVCTGATPGHLLRHGRAAAADAQRTDVAATGRNAELEHFSISKRHTRRLRSSWRTRRV